MRAELAIEPVAIEWMPNVRGRLLAEERRRQALKQFLWFSASTFVLLMLLAFATTAFAETDAAASSHATPASSSLQAYLDRVRAENRELQPRNGSLWIENGRFTRLNTDVRAGRPGDLISVVVNESLAASTDGTVKNGRQSNAQSGISGLLGTLHAGNAMQNLITQNSTAGLNATGVSATNSNLNTTFGGQVVDVLPNGILVVEAARQVEFNQQTQTIYLRGLVRPEDISQSNQVLSTAIASLELEVKGKGIINDYTHRQNPLVRLVEKLLIF